MRPFDIRTLKFKQKVFIFDWLDSKKVSSKYTLPFGKAVASTYMCILARASDISRKKSKISRDFQGQIRGKISRFRGIFAGKKSKFAEQSADFRRFSREKSQNSQENRPISRDFSGKESIFEGFSGANNFLRIS